MAGAKHGQTNQCIAGHVGDDRITDTTPAIESKGESSARDCPSKPVLMEKSEEE